MVLTVCLSITKSCVWTVWERKKKEYYERVVWQDDAIYTACMSERTSGFCCCKVYTHKYIYIYMHSNILRIYTLMQSRKLLLYDHHPKSFWKRNTYINIKYILNDITLRFTDDALAYESNSNYYIKTLIINDFYI
jgi:hypothetical protein